MNRPLLPFSPGSLASRAAVALVVLALGAPGFAQGAHKDERLGFEVRTPRGWKQIPIRPDESWIVGKYQADRQDRGLDPKTGVQLVHTPELLIVAFLDHQESEEEEEAPDQKTRRGTVYRDYQEYMRANYTQGFFVEEEEDRKHKGLPVTCMTIKAEASQYVPEKLVTTWVFETEVGKVAVQYEIMSSALKDHRTEIGRVMKSFKVIPRTKEIKLGVRESSFLSSVDLKKLPPAERRHQKIEAQRAEWENMAQALPDGWDAMEIDGVFVLTHVDKKYTKDVVDHVNALQEWLNESFPEVGAGEYARPPLIRICEDNDEERAFRDGSGTWGVYGTHLVTHEGSRTGTWEWEYIGSRTLQIWFLERDPELWAAFPRWLSVGLNEVARSAVSKRSKLDFRIGDREKNFRSDLPKADEMMELSELLSLTRDEFNAYGRRDDWKPWFQAVAATRFFVNSSSKKNRVILTTYLVSLRKALDEFEAKDDEDEDELAKPTNEEEEKAYFEARRKRIEERERALLDRAFQLTFGDWDKGKWMSLNRNFGRSL